MIQRDDHDMFQARAAKMLDNIGILITDEEKKNI